MRKSDKEHKDMETDSVKNEKKVQKRINVVGVIITILLTAISIYGGKLVYDNFDVIKTVEESSNGYYIECTITDIKDNSIVLADEGKGIRVCSVRNTSVYEKGQTVRLILTAEKKELTTKNEIDYQVRILFNGFMTATIPIIVLIMLVGLTDWASLIHVYEDEEYVL